MTLPFSRKRRYNVLDARPSREIINKESSTCSSNIKVVIRIRPENEKERNGNSRLIVKAMNENVLVFDPNEQLSPEYGGVFCKKRRNLLQRSNKDLKFAFDAVFGPDSNNREVYETTTKQILNGLLDGYNCSVFAYGATGAGKTHTMLGNSSYPGVMYLTMLELYDRINAMDTEKKCEVAVSYLEVYNEQIHDLLRPGKCLPVREDSQSGIVIQGLSLHKPRNAEELLGILEFGNKKRSQHPTDANAESSRSHAVFQVFVRQRDRTANLSAEVRVAKMCLVDLAGSERATVTKNRGTRLREGANINRSLLALGNVINALADHKFKGHIPYRDSKLTRLLKDSLGGNCQTVMIAAVSPSNFSYEDSYNTLKYADRAKHIRTALKKNILNVDFHVARYGQIVEELRKEIGELKTRLQIHEEKQMSAVISAPIVLCDEKMLSLQTQLQVVYKTRMSIHQAHLKIHSNCHNLKWKIFRKERSLPRLEAVLDVQKEEKISKLKRGLHLTKEKLCRLQMQEQGKVDQINENSNQIQQVESQVLNHLNNEKSASPQCQLLETNLQLYQCQLELTNSQHQVQYLKKVVRLQDRDIETNERLLLNLLKLVKQQHFILKGHGLTTSDIELEFDNVHTIIERQEVSWADQSSHSAITQTSYTLNELLTFPTFPSLHSGTNSVEPSLKCESSSGLITQTVPESITQETIATSNIPLSCLNTENIGSCSVTYCDNINGIVADITESRNLFAGYTPSFKKLVAFAHPQKDETQCMNKELAVDAKNNNTNPVQSAKFTFPVPSADCFVVNKKPSCITKVNNVQKEEEMASIDDCRHSANETFVVASACNLPLPTINSCKVSSSSSQDDNPRTGAISEQIQLSLSNGIQQLNMYSNCCNLQTEPVKDPGIKLPVDFSQNVLQSNAVTKSIPALTSNIKTLAMTKCKPLQLNEITSDSGDKAVTKEQPPVEKDRLEGKKMVIRAINFTSNDTPETHTRSYADAVKSPTPTRIPLKQMNGNNTPLAMPLNTPDKISQSPCFKMTKNERGVQNVLPSSCSVKNDEEAKENVKALQNLGLPSLVEQSYQRRNGNLIIGRSVIPGYLQPTKSVAYRNNSSNRNTPKSNFERTNRYERWQLKVKQDDVNNVKSRMGPRSQSTSSLMRPGWQF